MLGFVVGGGLRKVGPGKMETMRKWPLPTQIDDLISFLALANFIKEFIPDYHAYTQHLRPYVKKGARIADFQKDTIAHQAFYDLRESIVEDAAIYAPDFLAAADPESGRPFELWIDASEYAWACVLAQREVAGGCPRPLAMYGRSFSSTEANWSAWERELYAYRESR